MKILVDLFHAEVQLPVFIKGKLQLHLEHDLEKTRSIAHVYGILQHV